MSGLSLSHQQVAVLIATGGLPRMSAKCIRTREQKDQAPLVNTVRTSCLQAIEEEIAIAEKTMKSIADDKIAKVKEDKKERETWSKQFDFLIALIGASVGLGNIWRFPYLCYKHGGGAFLIPYLVCLIFGAMPLFYLEVCVGQFMGVAGMNAWNICPLFQGIGVSTTLIVFFWNIYYNVIMAWAFYYLFYSFTTELPWTKCGHEWNVHCRDFTTANTIYQNATFLNSSVGASTNATEYFEKISTNVSNIMALDPVTEFWENKVLAISDGIDHPGRIKWDILLCLLLAWIVVYICICKGIKSSGKVMYVTATLPYVLIIIILVRNSLLDGAVDGILYYLKPDISKLSEMEVWVDAGTQIFFSVNIASGVPTTLGSYNKFHHNSYRDCFIYMIVNSGTSILSGFLVFTIFGHMAYVQNITIEKVAEAGPGLVFIAYPKAISLMPASPFWSVLFFLMLILLGLDTQFVAVECVVTSIVDLWPGVLRKGRRREMCSACVCCISFLFGLPMVTNGGIYVLELISFYPSVLMLVLIAFCECAAIAWIYGTGRFYDNIEMMLGTRINSFMKICWTTLTPILTMSIFIMSTFSYSDLQYKRPSVVYRYPSWAISLGWLLAVLTVIFIPLMIPINIWRYKLTFKRWKVLLQPRGLKNHQLILRPQNFKDQNNYNRNTTNKCNVSELLGH